MQDAVTMLVKNCCRATTMIFNTCFDTFHTDRIVKNDVIIVIRTSAADYSVIVL